MFGRASVTCLKCLVAVAVLAAVSYIPPTPAPALQLNLSSFVLPTMPPGATDLAPTLTRVVDRVWEVDSAELFSDRRSEAPLHAAAPYAPLPDPDEYPPSRLGYLEHRGRAYPIEALTDPEWAQLSDDPFVRGFLDRPNYARLDANNATRADMWQTNRVDAGPTRESVSIQSSTFWAGGEGGDD